MSEQAIHHLKHEALISGVSNTFFNGIIAWLLLKGGSSLAWGGEHSFVVDMIATSFILSFIIALIVIAVHKRKLAKGTIDPINFGPQSHLQKWVNRLPISNLGNAFYFGLAGIVIAVPLPLLAFYIIGIEEIAPLNYAVFKGLWAGMIATTLIVPMVMSALRIEVQKSLQLPT